MTAKVILEMDLSQTRQVSRRDLGCPRSGLRERKLKCSQALANQCSMQWSRSSGLWKSLAQQMFKTPK
jgi:hypothetical protein